MSSLPLFSFFFPCLPSLLSSIEHQSPSNGLLPPSQGRRHYSGIRADVSAGSVPASTTSVPPCITSAAISGDRRDLADLDGNPSHLQPPEPDPDPPWRDLDLDLHLFIEKLALCSAVSNFTRSKIIPISGDSQLAETPFGGRLCCGWSHGSSLTDYPGVNDGRTNHARFCSVCTSWLSAAPKRHHLPLLAGNLADDDDLLTIFNFIPLQQLHSISKEISNSEIKSILRCRPPFRQPPLRQQRHCSASSPMQISEDQQKRSEIYTYEAPWLIYAMNWSVRRDKKYRLAIASLLEQCPNRVEIVQLDNSTGEIRSDLNLAFEHPYPPTKAMFVPDRDYLRSDLFATSADFLRIWRFADDSSRVELKSLLNGNKNSEFCGPLTSFDWNKAMPRRIDTSSIDTTCTIWDIEREAVDTQLIARARSL